MGIASIYCGDISLKTPIFSYFLNQLIMFLTQYIRTVTNNVSDGADNCLKVIV
jgi:hypothetical protein